MWQFDIKNQVSKNSTWRLIFLTSVFSYLSYLWELRQNPWSIHKTTFFKKNFGGHKSFLWGHWYPYFGLLVMSVLGFKARVDPLHAFSPVSSSDSPLVCHLLTVWRSAWLLSLYNLCTCRSCIHRHWWDSNLQLCLLQHSAVNHSATLARLS